MNAETPKGAKDLFFFFFTEENSGKELTKINKNKKRTIRFIAHEYGRKSYYLGIFARHAFEEYILGDYTRQKYEENMLYIVEYICIADIYVSNTKG